MAQRPAARASHDAPESRLDSAFWLVLVLAAVCLVLVLAAAYAEFSRLEVVSGALRGMGAVAAGLVISTAIKLMGTLRSSRLGVPLAGVFAALTFVAIAWLRWPLVGVIVGLGSLAIAIAWARSP